MKLSNPNAGIIDRLRSSQDPDFINATLLGMVSGKHPYPAFLPNPYWENHFWCMGATRSGKTARFMYPLAAQRIERNDGPVVYADLKGEDWLFQALKKKAEEMGRKFLWFSNVPYHSTYLFNPLEQSSFEFLTVPQLAQTLLNSLGLWHGPGYGRSFYSGQHRTNLGGALAFRSTGNPQQAWMPTEESKQIRSFSELRDRVRAVAKGNDELKGALELVIVLEDMANILQLDWSGCRKTLPDSAIKNAIHIPDLLKPDSNGKFPVVYFYLRGSSEVVGVAQIIKLFVYLLIIIRKMEEDLFKARRHPNKPPVVPIFLDEWQLMADDSIRNVISQASGYGVHFVFANQDDSQLNQHSVDLRPTIWENAGNKIFFTARSPEFQKVLVNSSGEVVDYVPSYAVSHEAVETGRVSIDRAIKVVNGKWVTPSVTENRRPRFDGDDIIRMNSAASRCLYLPPQAHSIADFGGYPIMLDMGFHLSENEFHDLNNLPWPEPTSETIVPADYAE